MMKKTILGLDLGSASIGWAIIKEHDGTTSIEDVGVRIIPLDIDEKNGFAQGNGVSKNQDRTSLRTARKGYDRYQLRRKALKILLSKVGLLPMEEQMNLSALEIYGLRNKAVTEEISLVELGRVLLHFNQKRGYKSIGKGESVDSKETEYVAKVKGRHTVIKDLNMTIGQYFYEQLITNREENKDFITYRIKDQVFPREAYIEEFEVIWRKQSDVHKEVLTEELKRQIQERIIFYQRPLKSQKGLVSVCELEGYEMEKLVNGQKKVYFVGPKVAPKTSPLFQIVKIWETIHNIKLKDKKGQDIIIDLEKKKQIFDFLNHNERMSIADLIKILGIKKEDFYSNKQISKGIQGNITRCAIANILGDDHPLLRFELPIISNDTEVFKIDKKTGEVLDNKTFQIIDPKIEEEPLYRLWHIMYSIKNEAECTHALVNKLGLSITDALALAKIDFNKQAFGSRSNKAMRKILPYLVDGYDYTDSASFAGYNHSNSLTNDEKTARVLKEKLELLPKNSLRQPIVEKVLNQMINLVNALLDKYEIIDEIRIELARELKSSKDERNDAYKYNSQREKENKKIEESLADYVKATRNNIIKYRLFSEINHEDSKLNSTCVYCGQNFGILDALQGNEVDVEHIIPKALLFDDSQSNKTLTHRKCNAEKGMMTAYDYMTGKGTQALDEYINRVDDLYKKRIIGKGKRDKLLMPKDKIPQDFIDRQLRETQYIAIKAKSILEQICANVWSTSGTITEKLRRLWGWEDALMHTQFDKYKQLGLTHIVEWETNGQVHKKEVIYGWSKRDDHRHHAMDALTIACTKQGFIQRINTLNAQKNRDEMQAFVLNSQKEPKDKMTLLEKFLVVQRPLSTVDIEKALDSIFVSFKSGKKVASLGTRKVKKNGKKIVVQRDIIIPRGALSEESVYGKIKTLVKGAPLKDLLQNLAMIESPIIRSLLQAKLEENSNNIKATLSAIKKNPIYLDEGKTVILEKANIYQYEYVIKYPITSIDGKKAEKIVDNKIKELVKARLEEHNGNAKIAYAAPLFFDKNKKIEIKTVRCKTGLNAVEPINIHDEPNDLSYQKYVKPGNNHHIALYKDENGNITEHIVTFWHAVERKKYGIPVIITDTAKIWDLITQSKEDMPQDFLSKLPKPGLTLYQSLQQNEMFLLGLTQEEVDDAINNGQKATLSAALYRVQKIAEKYYVLRSHIESTLNDTDDAPKLGKYVSIRSIGAFEKLQPVKVKIDVLGQLTFPSS
jgi:CRISPR-associated endonuclease Csn1